MNWQDFFKEEELKEYYKGLMKSIDEAYSSSTVFPPKDKIFNAFSLTPMSNLKVVLLGQDPYHAKGQAQGLAFSTPSSVKNPPSMKNILKEIILKFILSKEMLEDLVMAAINDATKKIEDGARAIMSDVAGDIQLPDGFGGGAAA